jgi:5-methylcytosine-specific restriction endonuclease McrA
MRQSSNLHSSVSGILYFKWTNMAFVKTKRKRPPLKTAIRSALRRVWSWSDERKAALAAARVARGKYKCVECKELFGPKAVDVDHIVSATPDEGINKPSDFGQLIARMLYARDDESFTPITVGQLQVMCKPCHKLKTSKERQTRKR